MSAAPFRSPCDLIRAAGLDPAEVTSPAIATVLDAVYCIPPTSAQRSLWPKLTPRRILGLPAKWPTTRPRQVAAAIGRRGLKTSGLLSWLAVHELLFGGHEEHAAAGSRIYALIIAPRVDQARESVRGIKGALDHLAPLGISYDQRDPSGSTELVIRDDGRVEKVVAVQAADSVGVRGFALCFLGFDEAGFLPAESWLAQTGEDLARSALPGTAQFPSALAVYVSSLGAPLGLFHRLVETPPPGTLVVRGSSWAFNPRISEGTCERLAGGDRAVLDQEYRSKTWGYAGTNYIDASGLTLGDEFTDLGPRRGSFVIGF